jgi:hypothetical protein
MSRQVRRSAIWNTTACAAAETVGSGSSQWVTPDSPTQRIGDRPVSHLVQVEHRVPMLSIDNTYSIDELRDSAPHREASGGRIGRVGGRVEGGWRGGGHRLRTWSVGARADSRQWARRRRHHAQYPDDLRRALAVEWPESASGLEVRGEVYMTNSDLVVLNENQRAKGEAAVCQHAECDRGQRADAGSSHLCSAASCGSSVTAWATAKESGPDALRIPSRDRRIRPAADAAGPEIRDIRRSAGPLRSRWSSICTNWISRSMGWS